MMNAIGINLRGRNKIINDSFGLIKNIIALHTNNVEGIVDYLRNLNKTIASSQTVNLMVYSPSCYRTIQT